MHLPSYTGSVVVPWVPTPQALRQELFQPQLAGLMLAVPSAAGAVPTPGSAPLVCAFNYVGSTFLTSVLANLAFTATQPPSIRVGAQWVNFPDVHVGPLLVHRHVYCEGPTSLMSALAFTAMPPHVLCALGFLTHITLTRVGRRRRCRDMSGLSLCLCRESVQPCNVASIRCQRTGCETIWVSPCVAFAGPRPNCLSIIFGVSGMRTQDQDTGLVRHAH